MPVYEYLCTACSERFSLLRKMSEAEKDLSCPRCSSAAVKKLISSFSCSNTGGGCGPSHSHGFGGGG